MHATGIDLFDQIDGQPFGATADVLSGQLVAPLDGPPVRFEEQFVGGGKAEGVAKVGGGGLAGGLPAVFDAGTAIFLKEEIKLFGTCACPPQQGQQDET